MTPLSASIWACKARLVPRHPQINKKANFNLYSPLVFKKNQGQMSLGVLMLNIKYYYTVKQCPVVAGQNRKSAGHQLIRENWEDALLCRYITEISLCFIPMDGAELNQRMLLKRTRRKQAVGTDKYLYRQFQ